MARYLGGFTPLKYSNGAQWTGATRVYVANGNMFPGDFVALDGSAAVPTAGPGAVTVPLKGVVAATNAATQSVLGVVVGFTPNPLNLNLTIGSTAPITAGMQVFVVDDPKVLFAGTLSGAAALTPANLGLNTVINTSTAGANGRSGQQIDATAVPTNAATNPIRILEFVDSPDVDYTAAGVELVVGINNHQLAPATGTVGV
jgi:hypothetical protein